MYMRSRLECQHDGIHLINCWYMALPTLIEEHFRDALRRGRVRDLVAGGMGDATSRARIMEWFRVKCASRHGRLQMYKKKKKNSVV
jgi:hypothetical protein